MNFLLISPLLAPKRRPAVYNIGLGYIAASLLQEGHKVSVLDIEGYRYAKLEVIERIRYEICDVIGIGTLITGYTYVKWLVKNIRILKPDVKIWVGNSIASTIPDIILQDMDVDVVVIGEGEETVKELAKVTAENGDLSEVNGICFKSGDQIIHTPERELITDIDTIPFPAWDLFPQKIHMNNKTGSLPKPTAYISTARGCPYHCTYCYHPFINRKVRFHSAKRVVEEIKILKNTYGIKSFLCADDLFIINKKRVYEICDLLDKEKIKMKWMASARVNVVDEKLLRRMKKSGCIGLGFGIESGSQLILDNINKKATIEQAQKAIRLCLKVGIYPTCSFMIGNVGETSKTVAESVHFIQENVPDPAGFFITTPYPETDLYKDAKDQGKIPDEIALFKAYGEQSERLLVNFTEMTDQELILLRSKAERLIQKFYFKKHPLKLIPFLLKRCRDLILSIPQVPMNRVILYIRGMLKNGMKRFSSHI